MLPPRSPLLEGLSLPSRTISPFDLSSPSGRIVSRSQSPIMLHRPHLVHHHQPTSPLAVFTTLATVSPGSGVSKEQNGSVMTFSGTLETGTLSSSLPELTHESSDMSMDSSSSLSEPTPDQSEDITGIPLHFNTMDVFTENSIDVVSEANVHTRLAQLIIRFQTPEILSISEEFLVERPSEPHLDHEQLSDEKQYEEIERQEQLAQESHDLQAAYEELESLRAECERLRSAVSRLPIVENGQAKLPNGFGNMDDPDSTITPIKTVQRTSLTQPSLVSQSKVSSRAEHSSHSARPTRIQKEEEFIMKIDHLVWRKSRNSDEVLSQLNLDNLYERLSLWERAVRTRYRQRPL